MLRLVIPESENWNNENEEFVYTRGGTIYLEHSLVSISKWEAKWKKPFLSNNNKTPDEIVDYISCMSLKGDISELIGALSSDNMSEINDYISDSMTATWFSEDNEKTSSSEQITSELIYYWMFSSGIPLECEKWHLNRLLTLIRVFSVKNKPPKKMGKNDILSRNRQLNEARRNKFNTRG
uniref:Uncharacterized protein n=1 Tax=Siphoviridae sp. ctoiA13 TaxID=2826462 RepID=A0A8S5QYP1_9CAUD|nr:MAG TPA: hypothetical protein [Siphoviridae sp. ctoiA13]